MTGVIREPSPPNVVNGLMRVAEYRGKQALWKRQFPEVLERLLKNAIIESTIASNAIEGVTVAADRVMPVLAEGARPQNRSEQELAGYRKVLESIHADHAAMPFTSNLVLQLHRDLFQFTNTNAGQWKSVDNLITESVAGSSSVRFRPTPAWQTAEAMRLLHESFEREWELGQVNQLLLIAAYVLDFLCIHPFLDGNGRMARLLTALLLYKADYEVPRWISLEKLIQDTQREYYDGLYRSSQGWDEGQHTLTPWCEYFAGIMLVSAYEQLEARVGDLRASWGAKGQAVEAAINRLGPVFAISEIERLLGGAVSRPTIDNTLQRLKAAGTIEPTGRGKGAKWRKL